MTVVTTVFASNAAGSVGNASISSLRLSQGLSWCVKGRQKLKTTSINKLPHMFVEGVASAAKIAGVITASDARLASAI